MAIHVQNTHCGIQVQNWLPCVSIYHPIKPATGCAIKPAFILIRGLGGDSSSATAGK
jgi:hypothetical protein